jgi:long-subunit acyl-CoA synthetase (AMP-forming)
MIRSCSCFGGYLKRAHLNDTDADDWFDTGDIAVVALVAYADERLGERAVPL